MDGKPDAVMIDQKKAVGDRLLDRLKSVTDISDAILGVDRKKGERSLVRLQPPPWDKAFITKSLDDTINFPKTQRGPIGRGTDGKITSSTASRFPASRWDISSMLDEFDKRIYGKFEERNSVAVRLADGQEWFFPKPWLEVRPVFKHGVAVASYPVYTSGPRLELLVETISECERLDEQVTAIATLAAELLLYHYDLDDSELDQLLAYRVHDEASTSWFSEVVSIATGRSGPKRSRWRRLTLLAQGPMPDLMLAEDAYDLCDWFAAIGRTVRPGLWCTEAFDAFNEAFARSQL